jgi:hypothetical protein
MTGEKKCPLGGHRTGVSGRPTNTTYLTLPGLVSKDVPDLRLELGLEHRVVKTIHVVVCLSKLNSRSMGKSVGLPMSLV